MATEKAYRMKSNGGTRGAVTGKTRVWRPGMVIVAPEGEFDHLPPDDYEEAQRQEEPAETATAPADEEKAVKPAAKKRTRRKASTKTTTAKKGSANED